jgi:membrane-bound ClpP family serine protease
MMEQTLLLWGFALLGAALLLVFLEVFVPSGGIIGLTAGVTAIAGVVVFWRVSPGWGVTSMLLMLVLAPIALNFALRLMPHTPVGKRLILSETAESRQRRTAKDQEQAAQEQALVGATGSALTSLRPIGTVEIDGTRIEALAEGGVIEAGSRVRVTSVQGNQVRVRAVA